MGLVDKLGLSLTGGEALLECFRQVIPEENNLFDSFYKINKSFKKTKVKKVQLCNICQKELNSKNKCPSETCLSNQSLYNFKPIKVFILDIKKQISFILDNHYDAILNNLVNLKRDGYVSDITSGWKYKYEENVLNLVLFADGVNYTKSSSKTIWALLSCIVELPQRIRESHENIISHSMWSGSNPDFNVFLELYNTQTTDLLTNGLIYKDKLIRFKIHIFVGDAPARCKICKSVQFNGKYGCFNCLHPTSRVGQTTIYEYIKNVQLRTEEIYKTQLDTCIENNDEPYQGIKGEAFLSTWMIIPERITIDYMHSSVIGTFKRFINFFFNTKNHEHGSYLGHLYNLNSCLYFLGIKYVVIIYLRSSNWVG